MSDILVFGAGSVPAPLVEYLSDKGHKITVASRTVSKAEKLVERVQGGKAVQIDLDKDGAEERMDKLVSAADIVVSLVPYKFHPTIARSCINHGKDMVTTSYISDEMSALEEEAKDAGIVILNELGVDPGIDHMSIMQFIEEAKQRGGKINKLWSLTGGLPAPEDSDNPLGYKFSWSPKGVLLASKNSATYRKDGRLIETPSEELFKDYFVMDVEGLGKFEVYPNRDSLKYEDIYNLDNPDTLYRGTIRNVGWCDAMYIVSNLGYLEDDELAENIETFNDLTSNLLENNSKIDRSDVESNSALMWLGLLDDIELKGKPNPPINCLTELMLDKMNYKNGEKDMILMRHIFEVEYSNEQEVVASTLIEYGEIGDNTYTAMEKTVALPAAIAIDKFLSGKISLDSGIYRPTIKEIYNPVMEELSQQGISFEEKVIDRPPGE